MINFNTIQIKNGIYDHMNVTLDVTTPYSNIIPTQWTNDTIFDAKFNGNLNAGNLNFVVSQLDSILVKRRKLGTQNWITLFKVPVTTASDLSFIRVDRICGYGDYEYASVPSLNGTEGQYTIKEIESRFNATFLCDAENTFKFKGELRYDSMEQVGVVGIFEPYGNKYATVVQNAKTDYRRFNLSGLLLSSSFYETRKFDAKSDRLLLNNLLEVLAKKKAKIVKDENGNIFMVSISGNKGISYLDGSNRTISTITLPLVEIGDAESQDYLDKNGFISS